MDIKEIRKANLKRILIDKDITKRDLAKLIGNSEQYVNNLVNLKSKSFSDKKAAQIADALGIDKSEFYKGVQTEMVDVPDGLIDIIKDVVQILTSGDKPNIDALLFNIEALKQSVIRNQENIILKKPGTIELTIVPQTDIHQKNRKMIANGK
jgi:transcriptional regulator with XRE-family HTH domain